MQASEKVLAFIAQREGLALSPYYDRRMYAQGYGQNDPSLTADSPAITREQAGANLVAFVKAHVEAPVNKTFAGVTLRQQHFDGVVSLVYNIGQGSLRDGSPDLLAAIRAFCADLGDARLRDLAAYQITRAVPKTEPPHPPIEPPFNIGRRCHEALMFLTGDYGDLSTLMFWDAGQKPKPVNGRPADRPAIIPMPTFLQT